ncbi:MAG: pitrilysin family protein [Cyclobacteriaceae bacterium]
MKTIKLHILITLMVLGLTTHAQRQTPPEGGTPKGFSLPAKVTATLENGMKSTIVQYGAIPKVNVRLIIKTGNIHETEDQVWLADLTGSLMREGTASMDFATLSKKAASMGGEVSVSVGLDQTTISGSVLSEYVSELIALVGDIAMNPSFPESELDRLKNDFKRQLAVRKTQPSALAAEKFDQIIYPNHPYGRHYPTDAMLNSYTLPMVKDFYKNNFGAKRSVLYVVGKFDESMVTNQIEKVFSLWTPGPEVSYPVVEAVKSNEVAQIDRKGAPQTTIIVGLPAPSPSSPDYVAMDLTNSLLGGSFGSRITSNIREDKGYTYSPRSVIQNRKSATVWFEQADVTTEHTGASLTEIAKEINRLQNEVPSKEEIDGIKKYEAGLFVLRNSSPGGIINQLNFLDLHDLDDSFLTDRVKNIYEVTPEKVTEMAKAHLKYEDMTLVLVGDKAALEKQKKELEEARKIH